VREAIVGLVDTNVELALVARVAKRLHVTRLTRGARESRGNAVAFTVKPPFMMGHRPQFRQIGVAQFAGAQSRFVVVTRMALLAVEPTPLLLFQDTLMALGARADNGEVRSVAVVADGAAGFQRNRFFRRAVTQPALSLDGILVALGAGAFSREETNRPLPFGFCLTVAVHAFHPGIFHMQLVGKLDGVTASGGQGRTRPDCRSK
jgi:hypothetical protein